MFFGLSVAFRSVITRNCQNCAIEQVFKCRVTLCRPMQATLFTNAFGIECYSAAVWWIFSHGKQKLRHFLVTTDLKATERPKNTASIRTYLTSVHEVKNCSDYDCKQKLSFLYFLSRKFHCISTCFDASPLKKAFFFLF